MSFAVDFGTSKGLGLPDVDKPPAEDPTLLVAEYVAILLFNPALMATKTSILLLYLRLAQDQKKFLRIASYVTHLPSSLLVASPLLSPPLSSAAP
jgi:hypothetical protein